jgi:hypothetical protein
MLKQIFPPDETPKKNREQIIVTNREPIVGTSALGTAFSPRKDH